MTFTATTLLPDRQCRLFGPEDDDMLEGDHGLSVMIGSPLPSLVTPIAPVSLDVTILDDEATSGRKLL